MSSRITLSATTIGDATVGKTRDFYSVSARRHIKTKVEKLVAVKNSLKNDYTIFAVGKSNKSEQKNGALWSIVTSGVSKTELERYRRRASARKSKKRSVRKSHKKSARK